MEHRLDDSFIVVSLERPESPKGRFTLWASAPDAQADLKRLLDEGVPASRIRLFRAKPAATPGVPVAA